jgi:hypothetical protein
METHCINHSESMAVATCKACNRSVCLMCVTDEKEGTFCSSECHEAFVSGKPVPVPAAAGGSDALGSIFDPDPPPSSGLNLPPSDGPEPIVAEGTKWRPIGSKCENHEDTDAVANCDRCGKTICPLCLLEAAAGTFCSSDCMLGKANASAPAAETEALQAPPPAAAAAAPRSAAAPSRQLPVNVVATGRSKRRGGGGKFVAAIFFLAVLGGGGFYGWDFYQKNQGRPVADVYTEPIADLRPSGFVPTSAPDPIPAPKPVVTPPKPVVTPPKPVDTPKPVVKPAVPDNTPIVIKERPKPAPRQPETPVVVQPVKRTFKEAPAGPRLSKSVHPWASVDPGTWFRIQTEADGKVRYTDIGVKVKDGGETVLLTQEYGDGKAGPVKEEKSAPLTAYLGGEESFTFNSRLFLTEVRQYGPEPDAPRIWTLLQGRHYGAVLREEFKDEVRLAKQIWNHTLDIDRRSFDCLVVETEVQKDGKPVSSLKTWYTPEVPMGYLRQEQPDRVTSVVRWGMDWATRPPFPSP